MIRKSAFVCALALSAFAVTGASAQKVEGTYSFTQKVRTEVGADAVEVPAQLIVTVKGDSASATWLVSVPGREPRPLSLRGTVKGNTLTLTSDVQQAKLSGGSGDERTLEVTHTYVLTVSGDEISGEITSTSNDDNVQLPARPLKGKRAA